MPIVINLQIWATNKNPRVTDMVLGECVIPFQKLKDGDRRFAIYKLKKEPKTFKVCLDDTQIYAPRKIRTLLERFRCFGNTKTRKERRIPRPTYQNSFFPRYPYPKLQLLKVVQWGAPEIAQQGRLVTQARGRKGAAVERTRTDLKSQKINRSHQPDLLRWRKCMK
jgi:hypothetical protein